MMIVVFLLLLIGVIIMIKCISRCDKYIGHNIVDVIKQLERTKTRYRIVERDGVTFPTTKDYVENRLNFHVTDNVIVKFSLG